MSRSTSSLGTSPPKVLVSADFLCHHAKHLHGFKGCMATCKRSQKRSLKMPKVKARPIMVSQPQKGCPEQTGGISWTTCSRRTRRPRDRADKNDTGAAETGAQAK